MGSNPTLSATFFGSAKNVATAKLGPFLACFHCSTTLCGPQIIQGKIVINRTIVFLVLLGVSVSAAAGPFNDKLAVCLVSKTTEADKSVLMRWTFAAMASHPGVKDLSTVTVDQGEKLNAEMAKLFMDLLANRCKAETMDAVKYEGSKALASSFEVLGRVAMQGLMSDPNVVKYMGGLDAHLDPKALQELLGAQSATP